MKSDEEIKQSIRAAIDNCTKGIDDAPSLQYQIARKAKGEEAVVKKISVSAILVIALFAVTITVALAAGWVSNIGQVYNLNDESERQTYLKNIQQLNDSYEGNSVRCVLTEALYDSTTGTYGLGWTLEPLNEGDRLYVVLDRITIGGEPADTRMGKSTTEYLLREKTDCTIIGELPENGSGECEIAFSILRPIGEIVEVRDFEGEEGEDIMQRYSSMLANGQLPMEGDGWIYCYNGEYDAELSYSDALLQTGLMEVADQFTLKVDISTIDVGEIRTYTGQESFAFDGYEIKIHSCLVTPFTAKLEIEYITDNEPANGGKGMGPMLNVQVEAPGTEFWSLNQGGTIEDPVQLADGRWSTLFKLDAQALQVFPEELKITAGYYNDDFSFTAYDDVITIRLTDR